MTRYLNPVLLLAAGILLNMALLHFFSFMETRYHPIIARSASPHLASALWATVQLALALTIILATRYRLAASPETAALFVGFCGWGVLLGFLYDGKSRRRQADQGVDVTRSQER